MTIESSLAATGGAFDVLSRLVATVKIWRQRRAWRIDLCRLDDHMLRDIGLERCEAEMEIAKPFWRR